MQRSRSAACDPGEADYIQALPARSRIREALTPYFEQRDGSMNNFFYIVCIVAIVFAADTYNKYIKMQKRQERQDPALGESLEKIEKLEERIRVLERIVTEDKPDLRGEIDRL
jgi:hypothetical protein